MTTLRIDVETGHNLPGGGSEYRYPVRREVSSVIAAADIRALTSCYVSQLNRHADMFQVTVKLSAVDADGIATELYGVTLARSITVTERDFESSRTILPFPPADMTVAIGHIVNNAKGAAS